MTPRFGMDTSILVRLLTGDPEEVFKRWVAALTPLVEDENAEVYAPNQVIGEAYIAVRHHYGVSKPVVRAGLVSVLKSGLVAPLHGAGVFAALEAKGSCGLLDRLITDEHSRAGLTTLALDRRMAALPTARQL